MIKKIVVVITARASYSRVKSFLIEANKSKKNKLFIILNSSSVLEKFGDISKILKFDNLKIYHKSFTSLEGISLTNQVKTTALNMIDLSVLFKKINPDIVVTIADRFETLATAITAAYLNIPLGHIQGGEISGSIDEKVRHSITKLSDIHFVCTAQAQKNLIKMGEEKKKVFNTGCPSIDIIKNIKNLKLDFDPIKKYKGIGSHIDFKKKYIVVMQHPVTTSYNSASSQINETIKAIKRLNIQTIWMWPNIDVGSDTISKRLRLFRERNKNLKIHFFKNFLPEDFIKLCFSSQILIGNSSVGIRESSYLGINVINIGERQAGRERGRNIIDVDYDSSKIIKAAKKYLSQKKNLKRSKLYGDGNAGKKILNIINNEKLTFSKILKV
jgi:bifunctional UDP-N-acetylglucosamine 2-epimerase / N-acetylmannosamine kinase